MYYRVAIQVDPSPYWQWKSTALSSLDALFRFLRLYSALQQDHLQVFSSASREGMDELLGSNHIATIQKGWMDDTMTAQENVALARSLLDLYNNQSDPVWLDKSMAAFAADAQLTDVPSGRTLPASEGFKQLVLFFAEAFPGSSTEMTNAFATEDQVVIEFTNTGPLHLPTGDGPATGRYSELRFCQVYQIKDGKIVSLRVYYDLMTMLQQLGLVPAMG